MIFLPVALLNFVLLASMPFSSAFFGRKAFLPAASFATRLLILTGKTCGFPRNAPFPYPAPGSRQQSCHDPGWPRFLSSRLARSPSGNRGAARCAAMWFEGRKRKRKVAALAPRPLRSRARLCPRAGFFSVFVALELLKAT